jgi:hypothetical protein
VRLSLLPRRLEIELLKTGTYSEGYVPGGLTRYVRISAPYTAVRGLVRRGDGLLLALDSRVVAPHNRFFLTHLSDAPLEALATAYRRRRVVAAAAWLAPTPLAAWAAWAAPPDLVAGALGRSALFAVLLFASGALMSVLLRWAARGGPGSERLTAVLERRMSQRLGFDPALFHETDPFDVPDVDVLQHVSGLTPPVAVRGDRATDSLSDAAAWDEPARSDLPTLADVALERAEHPSSVAPPVAPLAVPPVVAPPAPSPRPVAPREVVQRPTRSLAWRVFALAALVLAVVGVGALAARRIGETEAVLDEATVARSGLEAVETPTDDELSAPTLPTCACSRSDSPLWRGGVPVLSVVPIAKPPSAALGSSTITPKLNRRGRGKYDFDLAIVNNAASALEDVRVVVTFARRNERGERIGATDRGLFWGGALEPGRSVKWSVKGPGTELKIEVEERRLLGAGLAPAPADAFARLLRTDKLPIALHAATMLAYLGDPRGREHVAALGELGPVDRSTAERIVRASQPLKVCNVRSEGDRLTACAFNGTDEKLWGLTLVEVDGESGARRFPVPEPIPPRTGLVVKSETFGPAPEELVLAR